MSLDKGSFIAPYKEIIFTYFRLFMEALQDGTEYLNFQISHVMLSDYATLFN